MIFRAPLAWCAGRNMTRCIARAAAGRAASLPFFFAPMASTKAGSAGASRKALGSAVKRNRIRRRIREIVRLHRQEISPGWDIVIHPRSVSGYGGVCGADGELLKLLPRQRRRAQLERRRISRETAKRSARGNGSCCCSFASIRFFFRHFLAAPASFIPRVRNMDMKRLRGMAPGAEVCWR